MLKDDGKPEKMLRDDERELLDVFTSAEPSEYPIVFAATEGTYGWSYRTLSSKAPHKTVEEAVAAFKSYMNVLAAAKRVEDERRYDPWIRQNGGGNG